MPYSIRELPIRMMLAVLAIVMVSVTESPEASSAPLTGAVEGASEAVGHLGGEVRAIDVDGAYAYVGIGRQMHVYRLPMAHRPQPEARSVLLDDDITALDLAGSHVYVAAGFAGVVVMDVATPTVPRIVGSIDTPGHASDVQVVGPTAYVTDLRGGLSVLDVSNPHTLQHAGFIEITYATDVHVAGTHAFVASKDGLVIVDVSVSTSPKKVSTADAPGSYVHVHEGFAYVPGRALSVVDVSDPASPRTVTQLSHPLTYWSGPIVVAGDYAYSFGGTAFTIVDVSRPSSPFVVEWVQCPPGRALQAAGQLVYVAASSALRVFDVGDPAAPYVAAEAYSLLPDRVIVARDRAIVTSGDLLWSIDVSDPSAPAPRGFVNLDEWIYYPMSDVHVSWPYAYVATWADMHIVDVSGPDEPVDLGSVDWVNDAPRIDVVDDYLYVGGGNNGRGFAVYDVSDPQAARVIATVYADDTVRDLVVIGTVAALSLPDRVQLFDVSEPSSPVAAGALDMGLRLVGQVGRAEDNLLLAHDNVRLHVFDLSDASHPSVIGAASIVSETTMQVVGTRAYAARSNGSLIVYDLSEPTAPLEIGHVDSPFTHADFNNVFVSGGYAYYAGEYHALLTAPLPVDLRPISEFAAWLPVAHRRVP